MPYLSNSAGMPSMNAVLSARLRSTAALAGNSSPAVVHARSRLGLGELGVGAGGVADADVLLQAHQRRLAPGRRDLVVEQAAQPAEDAAGDVEVGDEVLLLDGEAVERVLGVLDHDREVLLDLRIGLGGVLRAQRGERGLDDGPRPILVAGREVGDALVVAVQARSGRRPRATASPAPRARPWRSSLLFVTQAGTARGAGAAGGGVGRGLARSGERRREGER